MADERNERDQLDRARVDPGGTIPGFEDGPRGQLGQDAGQPDPGHVEAPPIGVGRVEFYRQVNRAERVAQESAERTGTDVIDALGWALVAAGGSLLLTAWTRERDRARGR